MLNLGDKLAQAGIVSKADVQKAREQKEKEHGREDDAQRSNSCKGTDGKALKGGSGADKAAD